MTAAITPPARIRPREAVDFQLRAADDELLLASWLNAVIYEMASRNMLFSRFRVRLDDNQLTARALGESTSPRRHQPAVEVKGATVTLLRVSPADDGWLAQTVIDV
jgi:tRNA nucleotidyltransferase (CCA-adding enzyme)